MKVTTSDEIGTLAKAFNFMVGEIRKKFKLHTYVSGSTLANIRDSDGAYSQSIPVLREKVYRTIFFSDIRGFTRFVDSVSPDIAVSVVNEYLSLQARIIREWGGDVDKFVGDEVMAIFSGQDMASKALECSARIIAVVERLKILNGYDLDIGIGLNCGYVVQGNIGSEERIDFTVIGDAVNVAARFCSHANSGQILAGRAVYDLAMEEKCQIALVSNGEMSLKGKPNPVAVYTVKSLST